MGHLLGGCGAIWRPSFGTAVPKSGVGRHTGAKDSSGTDAALASRRPRIPWVCQHRRADRGLPDSDRLRGGKRNQNRGGKSRHILSGTPIEVELLVNTVAHDNFGLLVDMGNFLCADEIRRRGRRTAPYAVPMSTRRISFAKPPSSRIPARGFIITRGGAARYRARPRWRFP